MPHTLPPLQWLRAFESAARHSSFSAAARELNMTAAAISYQVRNLEEYFGTSLFERLPRGLTLTDIGRAYLPSVKKAFSDLSASSVGMFGGGGKTSISIRVANSFGILWLSPRIFDFLDKYPEIDVQLHSSLWIDNPGQSECDLEIRYGAGNWTGTHSQMLVNENIQIVGPLDDPHPPETIKDLVDVAHIHIMGVEDSWDRLFNRQGLEGASNKRRIKVDSSLCALEMVASGVGYALIFGSFAESYLKAGRVNVPFDINLSTEQSHHLIYPEDKTQLRPEGVLFKNWLLDQASKAAVSERGDHCPSR